MSVDRRAAGEGSVVLVAGLIAVAAFVVDVMTAVAPVHTATLMGVALVSAITRLPLARCGRGVLRFVSGCVVAQPVVHQWLPHGGGDHAAAGQWGASEVAVIGTQVLVALVVTAALTLLGQLIETATGVVRRLHARVCPRLPLRGAAVGRVRPAPDCRSSVSRRRAGPALRRGPPRGVPVAA